MNPSLRVINAAKDMMAEIKDKTIFTREGKEISGLKLKIGVHTGPCVMGVIGYHKP